MGGIGAKFLEKYARDGTLPDISRSGLEVTNIRITAFSVDRSEVTTSSSGITPDIAVSFTIRFHWRYCKRIIVQLCHNDQGSLRSRVTLKTSLSIEVVEEKYRVNVHRCDAAIKIDSLNFGSRLVSRIVNAVRSIALGLFRSRIEQFLGNKICPPFTSFLKQEGSEALDGFNRSECIDGSTCVDYRLVTSLVTTKNFAEVRARGEFFSKTSNKTYPYPPGNLTVGPSLYTHCAFYAHVSQYVPNTALYVYYHSTGLLKHSVCLPMPFDLTLRIIMSINPFCSLRAQIATSGSLEKRCTGQFIVQPTRPPVIEINNSTIDIDLGASAELVMAGCSVCTMPMDASTSLTVNVTIEESKEGGGREEIRLSGRALSFDIKLNSKLCPFIIFGSSALFPKFLERIVEQLANSLVLPTLNAKLQEGIKLPDLPNEIHLVKSSLHLNNGFITACFDLDYVDSED